MKNFLAFFAIAATMFSCGSSSNNNSSGNTTENVQSKIDSTIYAKTIHDNKLTWIADMPSSLKHGKDIFPDVPDSLLNALNLKDGIPSSMSCFLLQTSENQTILFDAGLGSEVSLLPKRLEENGIKAEDLQLIYITHLHGDHIGGMLKDNQKVFPNAKVYLNKVEHDAWRNMTENNQMQVKFLDTYKDNLVLFSAGDTLPGGVVSIAAYGHTPGHTAFQKDVFLLVGDVMHGVDVQLNHPEYCPKWDMDPQSAIQTRKQIIEYAKENKLIMAGMHFPCTGMKDFSEK